MSERVERYAKSAAAPAHVGPPPDAYPVDRRFPLGRFCWIAVVAWLFLIALCTSTSASGMSWFAAPVICAAAVVAGVVAAIRMFADLRRRAAVRAVRPDEPWLWDRSWGADGPTWATGHRRIGIVRVLAGLGVILVTTLLGWKLARSSPLAILFVIPVAGGAWFLWTGIRELRTRAVYLRFRTFPVFPGDRAEILFGVAESGASFRTAEFVLRCIERFRDEDAGLWCTWSGDGGEPDGILPAPDTEVRLLFDIPHDALGTRLDGDTFRFWELEVRAETDAGLLRERFFVPVYDRPPRRSA